jgi:hypothetical protein
VIRAAAAAFVIATAGSVKASPITQARSGETFHIAIPGALTLRLSERWRWTEPRLTGSAVALTPVEYFRDPGFREWRVVAHVPGRTRSVRLDYPAAAGAAAGRGGSP